MSMQPASGRFDNQVVHLLGTLHDFVNRVHQVFVNGATDAAIAQLDHRIVFIRTDNQLIINPDLPKLIHENGGFDALLVRQNMI